MKKIFISLAFVLTCFSVSAQGWYVGPQASLNLSSMTNVSNNKIRPSWAFGAFGGYEFNEIYGIEAHLMYSSQGVKGSTDETNATLKTSYINFPILAKFTVWQNIYFLVGPQFGFKCDAKDKENGGSWKKTDHVRGFDFGLLAGAGYQFDFGLRAGISYNLGLTNVINVDGVTSNNRVFAITVGWKF